MRSIDTHIGTPPEMREFDAGDLVVLLDADAKPLGAAPRLSVHTEATPLHLAFSCYVSDGEGRLLVTRRALGKATWPGVWTNSLCGHPRPGEAMDDAIRRRAIEELGLRLTGIREVLPTFRYRAVDVTGIVEHEICPTFVATAFPGLKPNPLEVMDFQWVDPANLVNAVEATPWAFSPWLVEQLSHRELQEAVL